MPGAARSPVRGHSPSLGRSRSRPPPRQVPAPPSMRSGRLGPSRSSGTEGSMKVAVFGLGYVGTMTAAGLAHCGHEVVGVDVDDAKVAAINAGQSPVVEPGILALIESGAG